MPWDQPNADIEDAVSKHTLILRALALVVLKSHIAVFSTTNTRNHATMVEEK